MWEIHEFFTREVDMFIYYECYPSSRSLPPFLDLDEDWDLEEADKANYALTIRAPYLEIVAQSELTIIFIILHFSW